MQKRGNLVDLEKFRDGSSSRPITEASGCAQAARGNARNEGGAWVYAAPKKLLRATSARAFSTAAETSAAARLALKDHIC